MHSGRFNDIYEHNRNVAGLIYDRRNEEDNPFQPIVERTKEKRESTLHYNNEVRPFLGKIRDLKEEERDSTKQFYHNIDEKNESLLEDSLIFEAERLRAAKQEETANIYKTDTSHNSGEESRNRKRKISRNYDPQAKSYRETSFVEEGVLANLSSMFSINGSLRSAIYFKILLMH